MREKDRQDADVFDEETIKSRHAVLVLKHRNNEQRTTRGHASQNLEEGSLLQPNSMHGPFF